MKKNVLTTCLYSAALLLGSCSGDSLDSTVHLKEPASTKSNSPAPVSSAIDSKRSNLKLSVFIDLSDRLKDEMPGISVAEMDQRCLESASTAFFQHIRKKRVRELDDMIQTIVEPIPDNQSIPELLSKLQKSFTDENVTSLDQVKKAQTDYQNLPIDIYNTAISEPEFPGCDIYGFLQNKCSKLCIDSGKDNVLVILTDGYIYHDLSREKIESRRNYLTEQVIQKMKLDRPDWQQHCATNDIGFILPNEHLRAGVDLSQLEVLVVGIYPGESQRKYGAPIIKKFWSELFDDLKVKRYDFLDADLPIYLNDGIEKFILGH